MMFLIFRSRWAALFWAAWICIGIYVRMEVFGAGMGLTQAKPAEEQAKPTNPWAKDSK